MSGHPHWWSRTRDPTPEDVERILWYAEWQVRWACGKGTQAARLNVAAIAERVRWSGWAKGGERLEACRSGVARRQRVAGEEQTLKVRGTDPLTGKFTSQVLSLGPARDDWGPWAVLTWAQILQLLRRRDGLDRKRGRVDLADGKLVERYGEDDALLLREEES